MKSKNAIKSAIPNYEKLQKNKKIVQKCKIKNTQQSIINFSSKNTNANSYKSNKFQPLNIISNNKKMWIRRVLVPNLTDDENDLIHTKMFIDSLNSVEKVEILPYETLGVFKYKQLGINYPLNDYFPPTNEQVEKAKHLLGITN